MTSVTQNDNGEWLMARGWSRVWKLDMTKIDFVEDEMIEFARCLKSNGCCF